MAIDKLYYIQNGFVGNSICWWRHEGKGYTSDFSEAGKFPEKEAKMQAAMRPGEDIAWPCSYIDNNQKAKKMTIDGQYLNFDMAYCRKRRPYKPRFTDNSHQIL
jgi:hypothetical protein